MRERMHSGDPAAKANIIGGFPSLSGTSASASLYSKMASTSSGQPRLQAKCRAVWPSALWASKREIMELLLFPEAVLARRSLQIQTKNIYKNVRDNKSIKQQKVGCNIKTDWPNSIKIPCRNQLMQTVGTNLESIQNRCGGPSRHIYLRTFSRLTVFQTRKCGSHVKILLVSSR